MVTLLHNNVQKIHDTNEMIIVFLKTILTLIHIVCPICICEKKSCPVALFLLE